MALNEHAQVKRLVREKHVLQVVEVRFQVVDSRGTIKGMFNKVKEPRKRHTKQGDLVKGKTFCLLLSVSPQMG